MSDENGSVPCAAYMRRTPMHSGRQVFHRMEATEGAYEVPSVGWRLASRGCLVLPTRACSAEFKFNAHSHSCDCTLQRMKRHAFISGLRSS